MSLEKATKLKKLYQLLPEGVVAPSAWLTSHGYSSQLLYKYVQSGWLEKLGHGAYIRPGSILQWQGVVLGLQRFSGMDLHVGGLWALNLQGYAHYLPLGEDTHTSLYGTGKLPAWVNQIASLSFGFHKKPLFGNVGLKQHPSSIRDWDIMISSPERAILELLYQVGDKGVDFTFAAEIFESLTTLSPRLLNTLLEACESRKVKRLFLFLADYYHFSWFKHLHKDVALGSGKLQIVKNGIYDKTYMITVPKAYERGADHA